MKHWVATSALLCAQPTRPAHHAPRCAPATAAGAIKACKTSTTRVARSDQTLILPPVEILNQYCVAAQHAGDADLCSRRWLSRCGSGRRQRKRGLPVPNMRAAQLHPAKVPVFDWLWATACGKCAARL